MEPIGQFGEFTKQEFNTIFCCDRYMCVNVTRHDKTIDRQSIRVIVSYRQELSENLQQMPIYLSYRLCCKAYGFLVSICMHEIHLSLFIPPRLLSRRQFIDYFIMHFNTAL